MTLSEKLRRAVLQHAIEGKLTKQLPEDGNAEDLLKKINVEKSKLIKEGKLKKEKKLPEITDDEIPFEIPANWVWVRQEKICWLDIGIKTKGEKLPYLEAAVLRGKKEPLYKEEGVIIDQSSKVILVDGENSGEIMIPKFKGYMGSTFKIFLTSKCVSIEYILYFFLLNKSLYKNTKTGSAIPHLNKRLFQQMPFPLPPLSEQKRIVKILEEILPEIDKLEEDELNLKEIEDQFPENMKNSILKAAMQGKLTKQLETDDSVDELLKKIENEKNKLINEGKMKKEKKLPEINEDEIPFEIPKNWKWVRQNKVCWLDNGIKTKGEKLPYLEAAVLRGRKKPQYKMEGVVINNSSKVILVDGENSGEIMIPKLKGYMGSTFKIFLASKCVSIKYILYFFLLNKSLYKNTKTGSAIPHLNKRLFLLMPFPLPPLSEQKRIVEKLDQMLPLCEKINS